MNTNKSKLTTLVASSLVISLLAVAGCGKADMSTTTPPPAAAIPPTPTPTPTPYTPPTAEQLLQMVAPIALFPDKLVAQVLAGSSYPDQITAANLWLGQNPSLKGEALQNAANLQPWDVSVKSLTAFPAVLAQMANNIQWTTALGEAYVNDSDDVMNAIQTMRLRAQQSGNLKTSQQMRVTSSPRLAPPPDYADEAGYFVIAPPSQTIVIESAQPDMVYVPNYNPALVYGAPIPVYPSYVYNPGYSSGDMFTAGIISFGLGILVGSAINHHDGWGWHSWGMNWGGRGPGSGPDYGANHGWRHPSVVYNDTTYVSRSTTIINRNHNPARISNNFGTPNNNAPGGSNNAGRPNFSGGTPNFRPQGQNLSTQAPNRPMTAPHFNAGDTRPGARPDTSRPDVQHRADTPHPVQQQNGAMTMPRFNSGDTRPGARPGTNVPEAQHSANIPRPTQQQNESRTAPRFNAGDTHPGQRPAMNGPDTRHNPSTTRSTQARDALTREIPPRVNNRGPETSPQSETGQRLNSNGFQRPTGPNTIGTENRQQNPALHTAPSQNALRSNGGQQNEMRQQRIEREAMPLRSNPEPVQPRPQAPQQQPHPQIYSAPVPQQPRFEPPQQPRVQPPRFEQPQAPHAQQPRFEPPRPPVQQPQAQVQQPRPQAQQPRPQQHEQIRSRPAKEEERKER